MNDGMKTLLFATAMAASFRRALSVATVLCIAIATHGGGRCGDGNRLVVDAAPTAGGPGSCDAFSFSFFFLLLCVCVW